MLYPRSKDDFTYLEVYRPVEDGLDVFLERARDIGHCIFGNQVVGLTEGPAIHENAEGVFEPVMEVSGVNKPRLTVYNTDQLHLALLDRRIDPRLGFANRFRYAASRLLRKPDGVVYHPIVRDQDEEEERQRQRVHDSLASVFESIAQDFGITDPDHVEVPCRAIDTPPDPPLQHLGQEVSLVPYPGARVTRMLTKQAGASWVILEKISRKAAYPYSPSGLRIPFARMPDNVSEAHKDEFLDAVNSLLPVRPVLGAFKGIIGGS